MPFFWVEWATMPWLEEAPLSWMGELWLNGDGGEGVWVARETKGLKASMGSIIVCKRRVVFE